MCSETLATNISAAGQFILEPVITEKQRHEVFYLRHQVYCVERGFEAADGDEETDEFDARSHHVLLRHAGDREVVGTVRMIPHDPHSNFPMQTLCGALMPMHLPLQTTGEISRFAISKRRRSSCTSAVLLRLALLRGITLLSSEMGLTHWLAVMEPSLIRLHQASGIHFLPVGPLVSHHGIRQPTFGAIVTVLDRIEREQPQIWNFLTDGGAWFGRHAQLALAA